MEAFNRRSQNSLDAYETYRQEEESDEESRINSEILSKVLAGLFEETMEILSQLEEANMYELCQHYGATDPNFKLEIDQRYPADDSYWTRKKLNNFKLNDLSTANDLVREARVRLAESPLRALMQVQHSLESLGEPS